MQLNGEICTTLHGASRMEFDTEGASQIRGRASSGIISVSIGVTKSEETSYYVAHTKRKSWKTHASYKIIK
jgi:hypothetical protein